LLKDAADEVSRVVGAVGTAEDALVMGHALHTVSEFGAAHGLAARWLWGQVYTARKPEALALMYPRAYQQTVEASAAQVGLDPFLAWAIMRRESGFRPEVVSSADARGLMQIIPPTAKAIAIELKAPTPAPDDLYAPEINVRFGTWYLSALIDRMGHPALCAASYNAGPSAVSKWMAQRGSLPLDEWIEEIPYKETRGYVKQVMADYVMYQQLYGGADENSRVLLSLPIPKTSGARDRLASIPGAVPALGAMPPGCRFAPRCPLHRAVCDAAPPALRAVTAGHTAACLAPFDATPEGRAA
jgi:soluble lytic murein transglycosylase